MLAGSEEFRTGLVNLMKSMREEQDSEASIDRFATGLTNLLDPLIRSGKVSFDVNKVTGTCPPNGGALIAGSATDGKIE